MTVEFIKNEKQLTAKISGSIDTVTAPQLERELADNWNDIEDLILDFSDVDYISSAGLRVMVISDEHMEEVGSLTLCNLNDDVREVFEMTGLDAILNIQ